MGWFHFSTSAFAHPSDTDTNTDTDRYDGDRFLLICLRMTASFGGSGGVRGLLTERRDGRTAKPEQRTSEQRKLGGWVDVGRGHGRGRAVLMGNTASSVYPQYPVVLRRTRTTDPARYRNLALRACVCARASSRSLTRVSPSCQDPHIRKVCSHSHSFPRHLISSSRAEAGRTHLGSTHKPSGGLWVIATILQVLCCCVLLRRNLDFTLGPATQPMGP